MKRKKTRNPLSYIDRTYRTLQEEQGLVSSFVTIKETDLHILADRDVTAVALELALQYRLQIEKYSGERPEFLAALSPLAADILAPPIVKDMLAAGQGAEVGPMAAVAGAISEYVGKGLMARGCQEVMVENGGDVFINRSVDCTVAIFAGQSPLSLKIGVKLPAAAMPVGICTSSGTVGHSLSFGKADAVTVIAKSTAFADAVATRLGNEVGTDMRDDAGIKRALQVSQTLAGVIGAVIICGARIGAVGDVELVKLN